MLRCRLISLGLRPSISTSLTSTSTRPLGVLLANARPHRSYNAQLRTFSSASRLLLTKTLAPPPPPTSSDKDAKGERILSKIVRAFTFSASSLIVLAAAGVSVLVLYLIFSELFLPSGDTRTLNKAVALVEKNEQAQKLLHFLPGARLKAYGELPGDAWVRNRPVHSTRRRGPDGKDRLYMRFHVESDAGKHGLVLLAQVDTSYWSSAFEFVLLDVQGHPQTYIVEPKLKAKQYVPRFDKSTGFLGVQWGRRDKD